MIEQPKIKRIIPKGWRMLTPTEKIKEGTKCSTNSNFQSSPEIMLNMLAWCTVLSYQHGQTPSMNPGYTYITPRKQKEQNDNSNQQNNAS